MIAFPCAKINLGLNIVARREDGYHNLETVFYPIPLADALEVTQMDERFPSDGPCDLKITGSRIDGRKDENLVCRAYRLLAEDFDLPRVHVHLCKRIPSQAGLGGGSSDAATMIRLLNEGFDLHLSVEAMEGYAARLGADCAFFITSEPAFATGIGERLSAVDELRKHLRGRYVAIVKPAVAISTREAFAHVVPAQPEKCCREIVCEPIDRWTDELRNDFESSVFQLHPELSDIERSLYRLGARYAQLSGSGSALFGIFEEYPGELKEAFPGMFTFSAVL